MNWVDLAGTIIVAIGSSIVTAAIGWGKLQAGWREAKDAIGEFRRETSRLSDSIVKLTVEVSKMDDNGENIDELYRISSAHEARIAVLESQHHNRGAR